MSELLHHLQQTVMVTGVAAAMMLVVEYFNVLSHGHWQTKLRAWRLGQYLLAAIIGAIPGCLGGFVAVAMYSHRVITFGALLVTMITTTGDESFVMLSLEPTMAFALTALLVAIAIPTGVIVDLFTGKRQHAESAACEQPFVLHAEHCEAIGHAHSLKQRLHFSRERVVLLASLVLFIVGLCTGVLSDEGWGWELVSLVGVAGFALFVVATVPEHFVEEHLWQHVAKKHVPRIFAWTAGAMACIWLLTENVDTAALVAEHKGLVLFLAAAIGIIPESGPHLLFVTLFHQGVLPFGVLLCSSIVQDGHGMLPLLASSRRDFILIKAIKLVLGLAAGGAAMVFLT